MFEIEIRLQGSETFSEFPSEAQRELECAIEDIVGCALLQIFDTLSVVEISVRNIPTNQVLSPLSTKGD